MWRLTVSCRVLLPSHQWLHGPLPFSSPNLKWFNVAKLFLLIYTHAWEGWSSTHRLRKSVCFHGRAGFMRAWRPSQLLSIISGFILIGISLLIQEMRLLFWALFHFIKKNQLSPDLLCKSFSWLSPAFSSFLGVILWVDFSHFKGFEWKEGTSGFGREIVMASPEVLLLSGVLPVDQDKDYYANSK